jgi:hypothetical protein
MADKKDGGAETPSTLPPTRKGVEASKENKRKKTRHPPRTARTSLSTSHISKHNSHSI